MVNMFSSETIRLKFRNQVYIPIVRRFLRRKLAVTDFTIISNNCWGGTVYETYNLPKLTPTAGMFIMPADYLLLVSDLDRHLALPLEFIRPEDSKWRSELEDKSNWGTYLIGRVGEVELHMLHYHDEESARRKWESRIKRVNQQRLIFKFNDQNGATEEHLRRFDELDLDNKIIFTVRDLPQLESVIRVPSPANHGYVRASYEPVNNGKTFNAAKYVNSRFASAE